MRIVKVLLLLVLFSTPVFAREIADVNIPEQVSVGDGVTLHLNGAGIRYKYFFKIYVAELYMQHPAADVEKVLKDDGEKRVVMHFIYSEVGKDKLVEGWNEGFRANLAPQELAALQEKINRFNAMFDTVKSGDEISLDYTPGKGTEVTIRGRVKGVVAGKDFNDALLAIWLGKEPVSDELRKELLGNSD
jgi:Chalcone isomerase-like